MPAISKEELVAKIRDFASASSLTEVSELQFRAATGVPLTTVLWHFDRWSDACEAAGVKTATERARVRLAQKGRQRRISQEDIVCKIRELAGASPDGEVSRSQFLAAGFSRYEVERHFDNWGHACEVAGVKTAKNRTLFRSGQTGRGRRISEDECVRELQRIASLLGKKSVSMREFEDHASFSVGAVLRRFCSFKAGVHAAGLELDPNYNPTVPIGKLVNEFLKAVIELERVPTLNQVARRAGCSTGPFCRPAGYDNFKMRAIEHILACGTKVTEDIEAILRAELRRIEETTGQKSASSGRRAPHHHGRVLGFRGFAHRPTYEQEVVGLFSAVAQELGFEILCSRNAFPDCEARRKSGPRGRYVPCMIEFEFRSRDYKKHKHPIKGCDLIVCWEHDWQDSPIKVLELKKEIEGLDGWE